MQDLRFRRRAYIIRLHYPEPVDVAIRCHRVVSAFGIAQSELRVAGRTYLAQCFIAALGL